MSTDHTALVSKVWNHADVLRDQGIGYGDHVEQIPWLLFLKMDQERAELLGEPSSIPPRWRWDQLAPQSGDELALHYRHALEALAREKGLIGTIFRGVQNTLTDPAKLKRVVSLIDAETWIGIGVDVKGAIYEGLLKGNAAEVKGGAGQYRRPRRPPPRATLAPGLTQNTARCTVGRLWPWSRFLSLAGARRRTTIARLRSSFSCCTAAAGPRWRANGPTSQPAMPCWYAHRMNMWSKTTARASSTA